MQSSRRYTCVSTPTKPAQGQIRETHQSLSAPPLKCSVPAFTTHLHPPPTPFPLHSPCPIPFPPPVRSNLDTEHVYAWKSLSATSSGITPVSTRPIAIIVAACVQMTIEQSAGASASQSAMIAASAIAARSCKASMDSPFEEGTTVVRSVRVGKKVRSRDSAAGEGCVKRAVPYHSLRYRCEQSQRVLLR